MEKIVRIMSQSPLATRQYIDRKTGTEKVMNSVALHLTDGVDNFIGEITGERAVNLPVLDYTSLYHVQCSMMVREWVTDQGETKRTTNIYIDKICVL